MPATSLGSLAASSLRPCPARCECLQRLLPRPPPQDVLGILGAGSETAGPSQLSADILALLDQLIENLKAYLVFPGQEPVLFTSDLLQLTLMLEPSGPLSRLALAGVSHPTAPSSFEPIPAAALRGTGAITAVFLAAGYALSANASWRAHCASPHCDSLCSTELLHVPVFLCRRFDPHGDGGHLTRLELSNSTFPRGFPVSNLTRPIRFSMPPPKQPRAAEDLSEQRAVCQFWVRRHPAERNRIRLNVSCYRRLGTLC